MQSAGGFRLDANTALMRSIRALAVIGASLLMIAAANVARAQELASPMLLTAAPDVQGIYSRAVVIALPVGNAQHVGFIINRVSRRSLASVFPKHAPSKKVIDPIYIGGPDALGTIFAFVRAPGKPPADTTRLFEDLFVTASPKAVGHIIEQTPNKARFVTGYISWLADELEAEIENGFWHVSEPHAELLFRKDVGALWAELIGHIPPEEVVPNLHSGIRHVRRIPDRAVWPTADPDQHRVSPVIDTVLTAANAHIGESMLNRCRFNSAAIARLTVRFF